MKIESLLTIKTQLERSIVAIENSSASEVWKKGKTAELKKALRDVNRVLKPALKTEIEVA